MPSVRFQYDGEMYAAEFGMTGTTANCGVASITNFQFRHSGAWGAGAVREALGNGDAVGIQRDGAFVDALMEYLQLNGGYNIFMMSDRVVRRATAGLTTLGVMQILYASCPRAGTVTFSPRVINRNSSAPIIAGMWVPRFVYRQGLVCDNKVRHMGSRIRMTGSSTESSQTLNADRERKFKETENLITFGS